MTEPKLTKAEISEAIRQKNNSLNIREIREILDLLFETIQDGLLEDRVVELRGFGTFEIRTRKGRSQGRNPKTGERVAVPDHGAALFRPGKDLKKDCWHLRS